MFAPPAPPLVFTPAAKGGPGIGGRLPDGTGDNGEPVPAPSPSGPRQPPGKDED